MLKNNIFLRLSAEKTKKIIIRTITLTVTHTSYIMFYSVIRSTSKERGLIRVAYLKRNHERRGRSI